MKGEISVNTMKAIVVHAYGGPETLSYEDIPRPEGTASDVVLRTIGASINPVDYKTRMGRGVQAALPYIPGWDVSGEIVACGSDVKTLTPGDAVFGFIRFPHPGNTYAEYTAAPADEIIMKPETLTYMEAAALPLAGLTAWYGLVETAGMVSGQRVLILGASGGVGHLAVQIAKARGAYVIGTTSQANASFVRDMGADEVLDYHHARLEERVQNVHVVFDTVGGQTLEHITSVVQTGGSIVSIAGEPNSQQAHDHNIHAQRILVHPQAAHLRELVKLVNAGMLRPVVEAVFPLREASKAHQKQEQGHVRGKLVLDATHA